MTNKATLINLIATLFFFMLSTPIDAKTTEGVRCGGLNGIVKDKVATISAAIKSAALPDAELSRLYLQRAILIVLNENPKCGLPDLDEAIRLNPKLTDAFMVRALAWEGLEDYDRAISDYDATLKINPKLPQAYFGRGRLWGYKRDFDQAIKNYSEAIHLNPNYFEALVERGNAWDFKREVDKAIADYNAAIVLRPDQMSTYRERAVALINKGDYQLAIADLNSVIARDAKDASAYRSRGNAKFSMGAFKEAAEDYAESQRLQPQPYTTMWLYLARVRSGQEAKKELAENIQKLNPSVWPMPLLLVFNGDKTPETAFVAAPHQDAITDRDRKCEANFYVGQWYLLNENRAKAEEHFHKAKKECPLEFIEYGAAALELKRLIN